MKKNYETTKKLLEKTEKDILVLYSVMRLPKMIDLFHKADRRQKSAELLAQSEK